MRLFGIVVFGAILSCFAGLAIAIGVNGLIICRSDPAGCGLAQAYSVFAVPIGAILAMIVFGIAVLFKNRLTSIRNAAIGLVVLAWSLIAVGLGSDLSSGRTTRLEDILDLLQLILPFTAVVATQWFVLKTYLNRVALVTAGSLP